MDKAQNNKKRIKDKKHVLSRQEVAGQKLRAKFETFTVKEAGELMDFLMKAKSGISRTSVKSLLGHRQVHVNNNITTQYNFLLKPGMKVQVNREKSIKEFQSAYIKLLYEDAYLLVIDKKEGLPAINEKKKERTAHSILTEYVQRSGKQNRVYIIHGLDTEASGLMVFAKDEKTKFNFQDYWDKIVKEQVFVGILSGEMEKEIGAVSSWVADGRIMVAHTAAAGNSAEKATTSFHVIKRANGYSMVEFQPGRKNQIRMHAYELKHPVVDDPRYGEKGKKVLGRLALHAFKLHFFHPVSDELMKFETPYPPAFRNLMKKEEVL